MVINQDRNSSQGLLSGLAWFSLREDKCNWGLFIWGGEEDEYFSITDGWGVGIFSMGDSVFRIAELDGLLMGSSSWSYNNSIICASCTVSSLHLSRNLERGNFYTAALLCNAVCAVVLRHILRRKIKKMNFAGVFWKLSQLFSGHVPFSSRRSKLIPYVPYDLRSLRKWVHGFPWFKSNFWSQGRTN